MPHFDPQYLASLALFAIANSITPGPNNLMMMASGANFGLARTLPHMAGVVVGFGVLLLAVGLGLGVLLAALPPLHALLYWGGSAYLLYLAWKIATAGGVGGGAEPGRPMRFFEAIAFQWINAKAWTGAIGGVAAFAKPEAYAETLAAIVIIFVLVNVPVAFLWTMGGVAMRRFLENRAVLRAFNITMGVLLAISIPPVMQQLEKLAAMMVSGR